MAAIAVLYDPAFEKPEVDEADTDRQINDALRDIRESTLHHTGRPLRSVHAKSHGLLHGEIEVLADLPPELAQGLFAEAARYPLVMRLSTTPGDILDDDVSTPRGLGVKIIGVPGARVAGSEGDVTQDFALVNGPAFNAPTAAKFLQTLKLLAATTDKAEPAKKIASKIARASEAVVEAFGGESGALKSLGGHPETHILGETFYSQTPLLYGAYMAKIGVFPADEGLRALTDAKLENSGEQNALRNLVHDYFKTRGGTWELRVQFCTNIETMPLEDASAVWPEDESPYVTVARITVPPQDSWNEAKILAIDAWLSFSPWHALAAHRPLGSVNRARKVAYQQSAQFRATHNHQPVSEPRSINEVLGDAEGVS
jgi:hypothetical protein